MQINLIYYNNKSLKWKILLLPPPKKIKNSARIESVKIDRCQYLGLFVVYISLTRMIIRDYVCILH